MSIFFKNYNLVYSQALIDLVITFKLLLNVLLRLQIENGKIFIMKKYVINFIVALIMFSASGFIQAQSNVYSLSQTSSCVSLNSANLRYRSRDVNTNGEVSVLQNFLHIQNYFNSKPTGYFGLSTLRAVKKFQKENGIKPTNYIGPSTKEKIKLISCSDATTEVNSNQIQAQNFNFGTIVIRAIVANIDEVGNKYGSYGMKFSQSKLAEVDQALERLNAFVQQSSYGKAKLQWKTSGVYELGSGVCEHSAYGDKVKDLIQRALQKADSQTSFSDYSYYFIVHPAPDCPDGVKWSYSGQGTYSEYTLNGHVVHLRGLEISDLYDFYVFHEFGHSLGYQQNKGLGHPYYINCAITVNNKETQIALTDSPSSCSPVIYDSVDGKIPVFTIMGGKFGIFSDYSAIEKENVGWLSNIDIVTTTQGAYILSPIEQIGSRPKALKIPILGTSYNVYVSFRQPIGYSYPQAPANKPNGVIIEATKGNGGTFLVTNSVNIDAPLQIGTHYRIGINGPVITVNNISNNLASITVSSGAKVPSNSTQTPIISIPPLTSAVITNTSPICSLTTNKNSYQFGEIITFSWISQNATYAIFQQDTSGKDGFLLPGGKLPISGSRQVTANVSGNPSVTLLVGSSSDSGLCSAVVSVK